MSDRTFADAKNRTFVVDGDGYPLLYALCCPMTGEPVLVIIRCKPRSNSLFEDCVPRNGAVESVGKTTGLLFRSAISTHYVETTKQDEQGKDVKDYKGVKYYYGLREDILVEKVFTQEYRGRKITVETFKKKLFDGKLKGFSIGRELIHEQDLVIACCTEEWARLREGHAGIQNRYGIEAAAVKAL
jgi:hypothetical protein